MPRNNYNYSSFAIQSLLKRVAIKSGLQIQNIADCNILSAIIAKSGFFISDFTLARLYKVIASTSLPSKYTLDLLSQYIGEISWDKFFKKISSHIEENHTNLILKPDSQLESELTLLRFCLHDNAFNPIVNYLIKNLELFEESHSFKTYAILNVLDESIRYNDTVRNNLLPFITSNEILRNSYFKYFMNTDGLNHYYSNFLETTYLKHLNPIENNYKNNLTWVYSVLITSYLYSDNKEKLLQKSHELFKKINPNKELKENFEFNGEFQFYPYARFHFCHIVYLHFSQKSKSSKIFENKLNSILTEIEKLDSRRKSVVLSQIFEALIVAQLPELIISCTPTFYKILNDIIEQRDESNMHNEEESLIQMSYYYFFACKKCKLNIPDNSKILTIVNINASMHLQYYHTYSFYSKSLQSILFENPYERNNFLTLAKNHASIIKNKFLIQQTK
jgi:hypothetical protein